MTGPLPRSRLRLPFSFCVTALVAALLVASSPFFRAPPGRALAATGTTVRIGLVTASAGATIGCREGQALLLGPDGSTLALIGDQVPLAGDAGGLVSVSGASFPGPLTLRPVSDGASPTGLATAGGHPYRGELEILSSNGLLTVVNVVPLEEYLLGVVPREMPASFPPEALKAQAVAARTYALHTKAAGNYAALGYDLVPTTACQVYGGVEAEQPATTAAVEATADEVVTYGGALIGAYFHSSSGGHTEDVACVWGFPTPYLKGVLDFDQESPHYSWTVSFQADRLASLLEGAGYGVGDVWSAEGVAPRGPGGRYLDRMLRGSRGEVTLRSEKLRTVLGLRSASFEVTGEKARVENATRPPAPSGALFAAAADGVVVALDPAAPAVAQGSEYALAVRPGEAYTVAPVLVPATFTFAGHGWGHGVGLSQWGARGMALAGHDYREILTYYYTGTTVGTLP